jgi:TIR domain/Transglycosylase SLT domain
MAHDVFISYAGEDGKVAEVIRRTLENEGIKCWIAPRDVPIGTNYEDAIIDAICVSRVMILIISQHSNKSPHVKREIQNACLEDSPTQILPLRVDAVPLNKALRYYLSSLQWLDASEPPIEAHLPGLVANVRSRLAAQDKGEVESVSVREAIEKFEGEAKPVPLMKEESSPLPSAGKGSGGIMQQKKLLIAIAAAVVILAAAGIFWAFKSRRQTTPANQPASLVNTPPLNLNQDRGHGTEATKPYREMGKSEKDKFIEQHARQILARLGDNPRKLNEKALSRIRAEVDSYDEDVGSGSRKRLETDPRFIFEGARKSAPVIIEEFNNRNVPPIIGLYLPMVESEYKNLCTPKDKGKGIFQMLPTTSEKYGVSGEELCDPRKSAQAAAYYMSELLNSWGRDSDNVTLAVFSFSHDPERVKTDLDKLLGSPDKERSFWTLVEGEDRLDREVRDELYYIPMFLAAAIVGENPQAFNLQMQPLSTYK